MEKTTNLVKKIKTKKNEKCGDCFYNGACFISLKSCEYLKKRKNNN